ncbi:hypothetical protein [Fibrobacter sp.]|uniref:hypothetical protein n=1 Tax=Fibrobacter sp. TaxID=35828 RepID=UPI00388FFB8D
MKFECKLMIWLAMLILAGCAGSNSSLKDDMQGKTLVKANSAVADSLLAKTPTFAQSVFKGVVDSVPGDYYYSVAEGKIDSLYNLKDGKYERNAGIRYVDSNHFVISSMQFQAGEMSASKVYQDDSLVREYQKGKFYRIFSTDSALDIEGDVRLLDMDSDSITCIKCISKYHLKNNEKFSSTIESDSYTGDAKNFKFVMNMNVKWDVKINRDSVKQYNDQGVLIKDLLFPKYLRDYYDNGNLKYEWTGELYRNEKGMIDVENGYNKGYYEDGQIMAEAEYKNKKKVSEKYWNGKGDLVKEFYYDSLGHILTEKDWNDNGVLTKEVNFPEYYREFYDNGKVKIEAIGVSINSLNEASAVNGYVKRFYENGQMEMFVNYKDRKGYSFQSWDENGTIQAEGDLSKGVHKAYHQNGKMSREVKGKFYYDQNGELILTEGSDKTWSYQGKPVSETFYDSLGRSVSAKEWNGTGVLITDLKMPKYMKTYWDDGKPKTEFKGNLYYKDNGEFAFGDGEYKVFYPNGRKNRVTTHKNNRIVAGKEWNLQGKLILDLRYDDLGNMIYKKSWNDQGVLLSDMDFPNYWKEYYDNGVIKTELQGVLFYDSLGKISLKKGTLKEFNEEGNWLSVATQKNGLFCSMQTRNVGNGEENLLDVGFDSLGVANSIKLFANGNLVSEKHGVIRESDKNVDTGYEKLYFKSGKVLSHIVYEKGKIVGKKEWDEAGRLTKDIRVPDYYREYYEEGKLKQEAVGTIEEENGFFKVKEGVVKLFDSTGKVNYSATYKDFQVVSEKNGD